MLKLYMFYTGYTVLGVQQVVFPFQAQEFTKNHANPHTPPLQK